jgi:hypothetical protein
MSGRLPRYTVHSTPPQQSPRLLDQLRRGLRSRHYTGRTQQTHRQWVKRFICFHDVRHPAAIAAPEINGFLTTQAVVPTGASLVNEVAREQGRYHVHETIVRRAMTQALREVVLMIL